MASLLYHLVAAALWVGGLVALLAQLVRRGDYSRLACTRFSRLALVCWIVMAASGVVNALIRVSPDRLLTTYGMLVLGKTLALLVLGVIGWLHRRGAVAAVVERGDHTAILRLGGVEMLVMFATVGLAVALSQTAPPGGLAARPNRTEALLGYDLAGPPWRGYSWTGDRIWCSGSPRWSSPAPTLPGCAGCGCVATPGRCAAPLLG
jgi:putative copper resistance protein D